MRRTPRWQVELGRLVALRDWYAWGRDSRRGYELSPRSWVLRRVFDLIHYQPEHPKGSLWGLDDEPIWFAIPGGWKRLIR